MRDHFRPRNSPAREIYDAFQEESKNRADRSTIDWILAEREAVWKAARDYALKHKLTVPTIKDIEQAELSACGHTDYGAKWAYGISEIMLKEE